MFESVANSDLADSTVIEAPAIGIGSIRRSCHSCAPKRPASLFARLLAQRVKDGSSINGNSINGYLMARIGLMVPNSATDLKVLEEGAEKELNRGNKAYWAMVQRGALHYRARRYDQALPLLRDCLLTYTKWEGQPICWLWLAMTQHQLGQREEAIRSLAKADAWFATHAKEMPTPAEVTPRSRDAKPADLVIPLTLSDWLEAHVLRREAAELIKGPVATAKK